jgi:1,2-diacylglycerol 3-alpha-glucosyltransferase
MKILFISDCYFPRINGVSTSIQTFRHHLMDLGHTVHLIAPDYGRQTENEKGIIRIPSKKLPLDPEDRFMSFGKTMAQIDKLRAERYDIIHIHTPFVAHYLGVKLSRLLGIPCIETYHTFFEEYLYHYIPFLPKFVLRITAKIFSRHQGNSLDGMVVPSHPMLNTLKNYGVTTRSQVLPTGIEPESFKAGDREAFRAKYGIDQKRPVLLFVGRVAHEKNIGFLLKAVSEVRKQVSNVLFVIAGEGPARDSLSKEAKALGIEGNVKFLGYLDRQTELNNCYKSADIFIFSSRTETQGLVLLEAMAQGIPVVSIAEMGTKDVLKEGQGVWIAKEEQLDFSAKVVKMLGDDKARKILGEAGCAYAQTWSARRQAERMHDFYKSIITPDEAAELAAEPSSAASQ